MNYQDIITIELGKRGGKPCIRGMRITVYDVLEYLASGMTEQEILKDFPYLTKDDILACLSFAAANQQKSPFDVRSLNLQLMSPPHAFVNETELFSIFHREINQKSQCTNKQKGQKQ